MPTVSAPPDNARSWLKARRGSQNTPQPDTTPAWFASGDWMAIAIWGLLAIGLAARLWRYVLRFPLWGDECLLSANFLDRGFWELTRPLDNHQVAPVAFLWIEEAATRLFGFSEYSLRLAPLLAGLAAVLLFFRFARRELSPLAALFAVGFFAVSSYAIRHSVEVKPYAIDALATLLLLSAAWPIWKSAGDVRRLWWLGPLAGVVVLFSYPAIFVAAAIGLVSLPAVLRSRRPADWCALAAYGTAVLAAFAVVLATSAGPQFAAERAVMREYWQDAFPPLAYPWRMPLWLLEAHTGEMFAYPLGGEKGGSFLTFFCFAIGAASLWRSKARPLVWLTLAVLGLAFVAAALQRYPYGGHPRLVQYMAPLICLLAGAGLARILASQRRPQLATGLRVSFAVMFALIGCGLMVRYALRPYHDVLDIERRESVVQLWNELADAPGPALSMVTDLGIDLYPDSARWSGRLMYRCYEEIYAQRDTRGIEQLQAHITYDAPLHCVAQRAVKDQGQPQVRNEWLAEMASRHQLVLRTTRSVLVPQREPEVYEIFEFMPRDGDQAVSGD